MTKRFKKIYIEITNHCNLACSFCSISTKEKKFLSVEEFSYILKEIKPFTDYIYLHVKGEPLLHPYLDELLTLCDKEQVRVNITTNGTLFSKKISILRNHPCLHQINFSLHSEHNYPHYCEDIFDNVTKLPQEMLKVYRFWTMHDQLLDQKSTSVVEKIISYYHLSPTVVEKIHKQMHIPIQDKIFVDKQEQFVWPSLDNTICEKTGYCYGLKSHIAILVDGTVVPCCLDTEGVIPLGNIFLESLEEILSSERSQNMKKGFQERRAVEPLCVHCSYKNKFQKKNSST